MRDFQRSKLYKAEDAWAEKHLTQKQNEMLGIEAARDLVDEHCERLGIMRPRVDFGPHHQKSAWYLPYRIVLPRSQFGLTRTVILHELAHHQSYLRYLFAGGDRADHGAEFAGELVANLELHFPRKTSVRQMFDERKVRYLAELTTPPDRAMIAA